MVGGADFAEVTAAAPLFERRTAGRTHCLRWGWASTIGMSPCFVLPPCLRQRKERAPSRTGGLVPRAEYLICCNRVKAQAMGELQNQKTILLLAVSVSVVMSRSAVPAVTPLGAISVWDFTS